MTWWQWVIACVGAFLIGVSKTGITGIGIFAVALLTGVLAGREAVGTVLLTLIAGDVVAAATYRREASWPHLWRLFPWTVPGVIIGAITLHYINDNGIRRLIGGILLGLIVLQLLRQAQPGSATEAVPWLQHRWVSSVAGLLAGFTTMIANAAGPLMTLYLLALRLPKLLFIGTVAWFFLVLNVFKVPFSVAIGGITPTSIQMSLPLIPFAVVGALIGRRVVHHIPQRLFEQLALGLTALAALRLWW